MKRVQELKMEQQKVALSDLNAALSARGLTTVLIVEPTQRPALEVLDCRFRTRRVYVQLAFHWFYWGDQMDERVSLLQMPLAADRIEAAARVGWRAGDQGEITPDLTKISDVHRH